MSLFSPPGPPLPHFSSLLVKGPYHASAPVHLCLSHARQPDAGRVVLVVPSRAALKGALKRLKDDWIRVHGGEGQVVGWAGKVDVLCPPTPAHLMFVLGLFHEALVGQPDFLNAKTTFAAAPSLLVLCDLSSYFTRSPHAIVSSYAMLVSRALATVHFLSAQSGGRTALAVFDAKLDSLRLPLVQPEPGEERMGGSPSNVRRESLGFVVQRYFEWVGTVEEAMVDDDMTDIKRTCSIHLKRPLGPEGEEVVSTWTERVSVDGSTLFTFPT